MTVPGSDAATKTTVARVRWSLLVIPILCVVLTHPRKDHRSLDRFVDGYGHTDATRVPPLIWATGFYVYPAFALRLSQMPDGDAIALLVAFTMLLFAVIAVTLCCSSDTGYLWPWLYAASLLINLLSWYCCRFLVV